MTKYLKEKNANTNDKKKERRVRCYFCGNLDYRKNMTFAPDPYAEDINGDYTNVWEHSKCSKSSADEC
jgi:hypothetical protein